MPELSDMQSDEVFDEADIRVAVLVPCRNEQMTVGKVVTDFAAVLPYATVYVYDNGSSDATVDRAVSAGGTVRTEPAPGKGNVMRRMFADVDADIYVTVDGDDTYDASSAPPMIRKLLSENLDMVVGQRVSLVDEAFRRGHVLGNRLFRWLHSKLFGGDFGDVFSGYRVLSRRLVKSFPTTVPGFEIEAEISIHAIDIKAPCGQLPVHYRARAAQSQSKLNTYRDGLRILFRSIVLYKEMRPARFFGFFFILFAVAGILVAIPPLRDYAETGQVLRLPSAILAASLELLAFLLMVAGIVLDSIARRHREVKRLHYLQHCAPSEVGLASSSRASGSRSIRA